MILRESLSVRGPFHELWYSLMGHLLDRGKLVSPRGKPTIEILGVQLDIQNYANNILLSKARNLNYKFMVAEWLWIHEGHSSLDSIAHFNSKYLLLSDDGKTMSGAYGPHWYHQRHYIVEKLKSDPFSRQAVMTLWQPNPPESKDIPCTISLQFILRDNKLHVVANMRSSDVWLGIPYDVFTFSQLGNWVSWQLGVERGDLIMQLGSSHMYEEDREKAVQVLNGGNISTMSSPAMKRGYAGLILLGRYDQPVVGLDEPWRSYAQILGRPRSEAEATLWELHNS